jgi:hypothetical protein
MHEFTSGELPDAALTVDAGGNVYGTIDGYRVYMLQPRQGAAGKWNLNALYTFSSEEAIVDKKGGYPRGGVVLDSAGAIYGTTESGGAAGRGVFYRLNP